MKTGALDKPAINTYILASNKAGLPEGFCTLSLTLQHAPNMPHWPFVVYIRRIPQTEEPNIFSITLPTSEDGITFDTYTGYPNQLAAVVQVSVANQEHSADAAIHLVPNPHYADTELDDYRSVGLAIAKLTGDPTYLRFA